MPNLEKFPTSASHAIRTSTPYQHAQRENRRRAVCREMLRRGKPPKSGCRKRLRRGKTAEKRFNMFTGLARLPRDTSGTRNYRRRAVVEIPSPHRHRRGATALFRNPVRGAKRMRAGILRILLISRAGGTPLPMAGRLTQLAKIISLDLYNRSSAVD